MTNRGLSLKLMAVSWVPDTYVARLDCTYQRQSTKRLGIFLRRLDEDDQYARVAVNGHTIVVWPRSAWDDSVSETTGSGKLPGLIEINVRQTITPSNTNAFKDRINGFRVPMEFFTKEYETLRRLQSNDQLHTIIKKWREIDEKIYPKLSQQFRLTNTLRIRSRSCNVKDLILGLDFDQNPICLMGAYGQNLIDGESFEDILYREDGNNQCIHSEKNAFIWSKISNGTAVELSKCRIWAIKGDRIEGVQVSIENFGVLRIARTETKCDRLLWDVYRIVEIDSISERFRDIIPCR